MSERNYFDNSREMHVGQRVRVDFEATVRAIPESMGYFDTVAVADVRAGFPFVIPARSIRPSTRGVDGRVQSATGAELIAAERQRQINVEGYKPEHDRDHDDNALAKAAACYATPEHLRPMTAHFEDGNREANMRPTLWPWARDYWKPTPDNRVRELTKAGALIAAEIDRINAVRSAAR